MTETRERNGKQKVTLRVLVADDDAEMRSGTRLMLSMISNTQIVAMARNGHQAVEMTKAHHPNVALMDINMPGMDGLEAIRAMQRLRHPPFCIIISAEKDAPTVKRAVSVGVVAYLIKPFTIEELAAVLEKTRNAVAKRRRQLEAQARKYVKARRTDDEAVAVLEALTKDPNCSLRWPMSLAVVYVVRQEWGKLRQLADQMEQRET